MKKTTIRIHEHSIEIWDVDSEMNLCLQNLFSGFFRENELLVLYNFDALFNFFEPQLFSYLDKQICAKEKKQLKKQDYLFNNLTIISNYYLQINFFQAAENYWERILRIVNKWESSRSFRVHKGSIYYFLAGAALLNNELDKGFFCIHKAYQEDCLTHNKPNPNTPAYKSIRFNVRSKKNYLYGFLRALWDNLYIFLSEYNKENHTTFLRSQFTKKFINNCPSEDLLISFTHTLSKLFQISSFGEMITKSDFAGLYELNLLFDLVLIIDNYLFYKLSDSPNRADWGFFQLVDMVIRDTNIDKNGVSRQQNLNSVDRSQKENFDLTIVQLLNREYRFPKANNITPIYIDLCLCYCIRNFSAHNIYLTNTVATKFDEILQRVLNAFFYCVEKI